MQKQISLRILAFLGKIMHVSMYLVLKLPVPKVIGHSSANIPTYMYVSTYYVVAIKYDLFRLRTNNETETEKLRTRVQKFRQNASKSMTQNVTCFHQTPWLRVVHPTCVMGLVFNFLLG